MTQPHKPPQIAVALEIIGWIVAAVGTGTASMQAAKAFDFAGANWLYVGAWIGIAISGLLLVGLGTAIEQLARIPAASHTHPPTTETAETRGEAVSTPGVFRL